MGDAPMVLILGQRVNPALKKITQTELQTMWEAGVIQLSQSSYSSLVFFVKKKDGGICFCIDYGK